MRYDLHIHTKYSKCSIVKAEEVLKIAKKRGLDGIAVTDHGTMKGALAVNKLNKDKDFEVIVGSEIKTNYGEVLVFYQNEEIKEGDYDSVLDAALSQGAIVSIAHPYRILPWKGFRLDLRKTGAHAVETFNSRTFPFENKRVKRFAIKNRLGQTGGSDAHFKFDIGNGYTIFEGDLVKAIKLRKTRTDGIIKYGLVSACFSSITKVLRSI